MGQNIPFYLYTFEEIIWLCRDLSFEFRETPLCLLLYPCELWGPDCLGLRENNSALAEGWTISVAYHCLGLELTGQWKSFVFDVLKFNLIAFYKKQSKEAWSREKCPLGWGQGPKAVWRGPFSHRTSYHEFMQIKLHCLGKRDWAMARLKDTEKDRQREKITIFR